MHQGHMPASRTADAPSGDSNTRALKISGLLTGVYFVFELAIGIWTGSVAVLCEQENTRDRLVPHLLGGRRRAHRVGRRPLRGPPRDKPADLRPDTRGDHRSARQRPFLARYGGICLLDGLDETPGPGRSADDADAGGRVRRACNRGHLTAAPVPRRDRRPTST